MNDIATPEHLFSFLAIDQEGITPAQRERVQMILDGVAGEICNFTDMTFKRRTETLVLDGDGSNILQVERPLHAVTSLTYGGAVPVEMPITEYEWSKDGRIRRRGCTWLSLLNYYTVTVDHGWDEVPPDVRLICLRVAARGFANPTGLAQESAGGWQGGYGFDNSRFAQLTEADEKQLRMWMNR